MVAHPDDDTYGVGGTVALHAASGIEVTAIIATSGEAGRIFDPSLATRETLGRVREAEDRASWDELGVQPTLHFLRHPDGRLANVPREELVAEIVDMLVAALPDVVVTFGPEGVTAHEDHVALGAAAAAAFHVVRAEAGSGFRRLLFVALPQSRIDRFNRWLVEHGMEAMDQTQPFTPRGVPDETIGVVVDCLSVWDRKLEALRRHRTQGELEEIPYELWPEILGSEAFVVGWPEPAERDSVLGDVFEGLPDA